MGQKKEMSVRGWTKFGMRFNIWNSWKQDSRFYLLPSVVVGEDWGYFIEVSFLLWSIGVMSEVDFR